MMFGYARSNTNGPTAAYNFRHGCDKWSVTIRNWSAVGVEPGVVSAPLLRVLSANPFRGTVALRVEPPAAGRALARVHDAHGRLVRTLVDGELTAGGRDLAWDGRSDGGTRCPTGIYFVRAEVAGSAVSARVVRID
jgi:hypothetical protein